MEMMILHGRAVARGLSRAMLVVDMPFGAYEEGPAQAFRNAARLMAETGAAAVKLEGGAHMAETIAFLAARGVPVMAHVGLTPQAVNTLGGYRVQGRGEDAERIREDAATVAGAGAFAVVLEKVPDVPRSPGPCRSPPSVSAPRRSATGRFWSWTACWGSSPRSGRNS